MTQEVTVPIQRALEAARETSDLVRPLFGDVQMGNSIDTHAFRRPELRPDFAGWNRRSSDPGTIPGGRGAGACEPTRVLSPACANRIANYAF